MLNSPGFCFYGDFEWPPSPNNADRIEDTAAGAVVVRFAEHPQTPGNKAAWMVWIPAAILRKVDRFADLPPLKLPQEDVYSADNIWRTFDKNQVRSLWLHDQTPVVGKKATKERLWFTGGWLLDVFHTSTAAAPSLRLPLARRFGLAKGAVQHSRLIFGQSLNTNFRFDLGLPVPVEQTNRSGWANSPVFVFSVLYQPTPDAGTNPMVIDTVVAGRAENSSKKLESNNLPPRETRFLGSFGFAIGSNDRMGFANFKGISGSNHWPTSKEQPVLRAIERLGFTVEKRSSYTFLTTSALSDSMDDELSLAFANDGTRHQLRYKLRQSVDIGSSHVKPGDEDDVVRRDRSGASNDKVLHFRFRHDTGRWLNAETKAIDYDFVWSWKKAEDAPGDTMTALLDNKQQNDLLSPVIDVQLSWAQPVEERVGRDVPPDKQQEDTDRFGLLDGAIRSMRSARLALQQAEGAQPQSFLPELELRKLKYADKKDVNEVRFALFPQNLSARLDDDGLLDWSNPKPASPEKRQFRLSLAKCPAGTPNGDACKVHRLSFRAWFASALGETPNYAQHSHLVLTHDEKAAATGGGDTSFASYRIHNDGEGDAAGSDEHQEGHKTRRYILGALDFHRAASQMLHDDAGDLYSQLAISRGALGPKKIIEKETVVGAPLGVDLTLRLAIDRVMPQTVDLPRGSRADRTAPILIPAETVKDKPQDAAEFILDVAEHVGDRSDWRLTARLTDVSAAATGEKVGYVVMSEQPFGLFRFFRAPFGEQGDAGRAVVAEYDSVARNWQFLNSASYRYTLPAQSLGEGADKPRRLEIHDPVADDFAAHRPYPWDTVGNKAREDSSFVVDYRLTPPADLWISPSDVERGYALPEWSAHDIFRQRSDFGLGVAMQGLRAEYLYGMPVGVATSRETGPGRTARVAEIEALTGEILDAATHNAPYEPFDQRWRAVQQALRNRPERLEVWTLDAAGDRPFGSTRFTDGTAFALRHTALHRPPIPTPGDPQAEDLPATPRPGISPRFHEQGLSGGALWPLESRNFFDRLLERPESAGGTIERLALSPFGGDADQTASFLNGTLRVISQTRNGRIQRQQVEILGRCAAFWHRAKHVVVYERTVNASAQFAPDIDPANPCAHETRTRRPVLRKVAEYCELLEPVRRYPDFDGVSAKTTGFLDSVRFNARIINVDSAWSEDVGTEGWKIPLWNRHAARRRPKVYPRPDISFVTVADGIGERPLVAQECLDPENIYFFAEALGNPDTDTWKPYLGVDYANVVDAGEMLRWFNDNAGPQEADRYDSPRARNASRILPGYRRFTWRLAPAGARTRLNAERGQRPIYSGLESVTFMRSSAGAGKEVDVIKTNVKTLLEKAALLTGELGNTAPPPIWAPGSVPKGLESERAAFQAILDAVDAKNKAAAKKAFDAWVEAHVGEVGSRPVVDTLLNNGLGTFVGDVSGKFAGLLKAGESFEEGLGSKCGELRDRARRGIQQKRRLIAEDIRDFCDTLDAKDFPNNTKAEWIDRWVVDLTKRLDDLLEPARADVGNVRAGIETIRAAVGDAEADIDAALRAASSRIDQLVASYDQAKPWSDARLAELRAKLARELNAIQADIDAALDEARQRIATELDDTAQRIGAAATKLLGDIATAKLESVKALRRASDTIRGIVTKADGAVSKADQALGKAEDAIAKALMKGPDKTIYKDAKTAVDDARRLVDSAEGLVEGLVEAFVKDEAKLVEYLRVKIPEIADRAAGVVDSVRAALIDNVDWIDELATDGLKASSDELKALQDDLAAALDVYADWAANEARKAFDYALHLVRPLRDWLDSELRVAIRAAATLNAEVMTEIDGLAAQIDGQIGKLQAALAGSPSIVATGIGEAVFRPALEYVLAPISEADLKNVQNGHTRVQAALDELADEAERRLTDVSSGALGAVDKLTEACQAISAGVKDVRAYLERDLAALRRDFEAIYGDQVVALKKVLTEFEEAQSVLRELRAFDGRVSALYNDAASTVEYGRAYADRVLDEAGKLGTGGLSAAPNNLLRLYSAATSAPELAMLQTNIDRMRTTFSEAEDFLRSSKAKAFLGRLGDALKAMGLDLPFDELGDQFRIRSKDLEGLDLSKLFRNFGGMKLDGLFNGVTVPEDVREAIDRHVRVSHDFDRKAARAWVQVDVDVPIRGTRTLFEIGPFKANLRDSTLIGRLRLEASKDADRVQETGNAVIATAIELQVTGQTMVTLEQVALRFSKEGGMDFEFDPKRIRLNPAFQFIQDTLGKLFPDEFGGLQILKENGIPVGLEHVFTMPPVSLNFGTSGVSNIAISNRFSLRAFPDFVIADRFNLSRSELPFIFSIFIIGGTGYIQIDTEYRPFDKRLSVMVEAAAGGSAALAFALGPVAGGVYIALSVALTYRKVIGSPEGGLSVGVVLVIAGNVSLWGMVTILLTIMLRMTYHDDGRIDAVGSLSVEVRVSRFFKLKFRSAVTYQLRGGRATTTVASSIDTEIDPELKEKAERLKKLREKL